MPTQMTTTEGAHLRALVQKAQQHAVPRTAREGGTAQAADAQAPDFRATLQRLEAARQQRAQAPIP